MVSLEMTPSFNRKLNCYLTTLKPMFLLLLKLECNRDKIELSNNISNKKKKKN